MILKWLLNKQAKKHFSQKSDQKMNPQFNKSVEYIKTNCGEQITLEQLVSKYGLSSEKITKHYKTF